ncbi:GNAT family N-acetyltransferase [Mycolicibacterium fluoranthenivorans]|uniref:GNAT family N-acetyltransferase n=1 Tax=Mycolicibacterium fluoranthenivorans TaxID=258505 RepID=A0A7G8PJH8_9MYCO|nr:GNAT family N-acetyltransferase [Mycolicibacterium fluoranthenivorans]
MGAQVHLDAGVHRRGVRHPPYPAGARCTPGDREGRRFGADPQAGAGGSVEDPVQDDGVTDDAAVCSAKPDFLDTADVLQRWSAVDGHGVSALDHLDRSSGARRPGGIPEAEEPNGYLAVIGSDPSVRGKGLGHVLMQSRLDRVDAEHAPAYLESSNPDNIAYYQRFGFEVTGEIRLPGGPALWPMWRAAR